MCNHFSPPSPPPAAPRLSAALGLMDAASLAAPARPHTKHPHPHPHPHPLIAPVFARRTQLAEEISRLREALIREKNEKATLLKAIYRGEGGVQEGDLDGMDFGNSSPEHLSQEFENVAGEDGSGDNDANVDRHAQMRVVLAQRNMLEQRQEEIEATHRDQEEVSERAK